MILGPFHGVSPTLLSFLPLNKIKEIQSTDTKRGIILRETPLRSPWASLMSYKPQANQNLSFNPLL